MTSINFPSVSVGFPVYNEEETVGGVLNEAHRLFSGSGLDYEILVCNDGSTDRSREIIEDMAGRFPHFRVIGHQRNLGIHTTFEHLYREAKKDFVFINATDGQWDTAVLFKMLPLAEKADIIVASRKKKPYGMLRNFISHFFNTVPFVLFGVRTFDAGAVKLLKREIIERFPLVSKSPFSEAERLIRASRAGYRILDYPVEVYRRKAGRSHGVKPKVLLKALMDVLRVWHSIHCRGREIRR
jgi:glycosyltransferase involved in cell wall biosynthesis